MAERKLPNGKTELRDIDRDNYLINQGMPRNAVMAIRYAEIRAEIEKRMENRRLSDYKDIHPATRYFYLAGDVIGDIVEYLFPVTELEAHERIARFARSLDD